MTLLPHDPHVHFVCVNIQGQGPLIGLIAQKFPAHKPLYDLDFVVVSTLTRHFSFLSILPQRPKGDAGDMGAAEVLQKISIQIGIQFIKRDSRLGT